jgi:hypothetical protein
MNVPQIAKATDMQKDYSGLLRKTANGPVFIAQRSNPVAALLAIGEYEELVNDAKQWRRQQLVDQRVALASAHPELIISFDQVASNA